MYVCSAKNVTIANSPWTITANGMYVMMMRAY